MTNNFPKSKAIRYGRVLAYTTIGWNSLEAIIAVGVGNRRRKHRACRLWI